MRCPRPRLSLRPLAWLGLALAALVLAPAAARAHPLGNFTINHYSRLDLSGREVRLHLVVDMAEIPAFQEIRRIDADGDGTPSAAEQAAYLAAEVERLRQGLRLTVDGQNAPLRVVGQSIAFPPGQGGLSLLRIEVDFAAALPADGREVSLRYEDGTFPGHLGWREIVVRGGPGVDALQSDAPAESVSDELRRYPQDALASPLDARVAMARFQADPAAARDALPAVPAGSSAAAPVHDPSGAGFTRLIGREDRSARVLLLSLLAAVAWGGLHALGPGHGKTIVAAYLVGSRGTARHAAALGATVTMTHTASVFALGGLTLLASETIVPSRLYPWLSLASGLMVAAVGLVLLRRRLQASRPGHAHDPGNHGHHDHHGHDHHGHAHLPESGDRARITWRSLLALGVSGGLLPCPSALIALLGAISLDRVGFGLLLVTAFSLGLAAVLTGIGLALLYSARLAMALDLGRWAARGPEPLARDGRLARRVVALLPVGSALVVTALGLAIAARAAGQTLLGL